MRTVVPFGDAKAQKKWSGKLFIDTNKKSYWARKFVGESENAVIQRLTDLESGPGDRVSFDLSVQLRQKPVYGDNRAEGKEEQLKFFTDEVVIDQLRHPVSAGGRMTRKRTAHDLRNVAKERLSDYWAQFIDEMNFIYLSGARGINEDFIEDTTWAGHANNSIQAPDTAHLIYGGNATAKNNVDSADVMSKATIERFATKTKMMRATDPTTANMLPVMVEGEPHYVVLMSPFQTHSLRTADTSGWIDIQKAAAAAEGRNNPLFKGGLGMIAKCVLHEHESVIRFSDYGAAGPPGVLPAARALGLGRQAGVVAHGTAGGLRFTWKEENRDYGNEPTVIAGTIIGVKKTRFNSKDFGVCAIDTYAIDPNV